jgi:hypothetical protein
MMSDEREDGHEWCAGEDLKAQNWWSVSRSFQNFYGLTKENHEHPHSGI